MQFVSQLFVMCVQTTWISILSFQVNLITIYLSNHFFKTN